MNKFNAIVLVIQSLSKDNQNTFMADYNVTCSKEDVRQAVADKLRKNDISFDYFFIHYLKEGHGTGEYVSQTETKVEIHCGNHYIKTMTVPEKLTAGDLVTVEGSNYKVKHEDFFFVDIAS